MAHQAHAVALELTFSIADVKQVQITFDCENPMRVAEFWNHILGYVFPDPPPGFNESCMVMQDVEGNEFCLD